MISNQAALPLWQMEDQESGASSWTVPIAVTPYGAFNINRGVKSLSCARTVPGRHSKWSRGDQETETTNGRAANAVVRAPATSSPIRIVRRRNKRCFGLGIVIGADPAGPGALSSTLSERAFKM